MIQPRALEPSLELCCLPTPHRISHYVAGMAFNFSKIEMSHYVIQRKPQQSAKTRLLATPLESA
ncbi:MAG TPA: hypothetical protein VHU44_15625 [Acidobacteriaceae bacterium]|jgi:hypothetical protein|nr:hypothetical protein [Acidobacteriaceae bacterium]